MNNDELPRELDDWGMVCRFLPAGWQDQAFLCGAFQRSRKIADPAVLLRVLLVHLASGDSLRQTASYARQAGWCSVSAVDLFRRLRSAESWLRWLANGVRPIHDATPLRHGWRVRAVDATTVQRPGSTGTDWRIHYAVNLEDLQCDHFELTDYKGGETFRRIPISPGDVLLGDRAYGTPPGIGAVAQAGGHVLVRVNYKALPLMTLEGKPLALRRRLKTLTLGTIGQWPAVVHHEAGERPGRLIAVKRSGWAAALERRALEKRASKKQKSLSRRAWFLAGYFYVWTDTPQEILDAASVLSWYRCRWQIELCFKRMKSILGLGELPKKTDASCRAWLHGKMLVALLLERILHEAESFSPWGYELDRPTQPLA
jgi:Transposase DDE domain